jgi:hypothetical protein
VADGSYGTALNKIRRLLLGRTRLVMLVIGLLVALLVTGAALIDEGEVVLLTIEDDQGRLHETDLWVVDLDGRPYLRAAQPDATWLAWVRAHPRIVLHRAGAKRQYLAVVVETRVAHDRVRHEMALKYGFADRFWSWVSDRSLAVAIRLDIEAGSEAPGGELVGKH